MVSRNLKSVRRTGAGAGRVSRNGHYRLIICSAAFVGMLAVSLSGCTLAPHVTRPDAPEKLPDVYTNPSRGGAESEVEPTVPGDEPSLENRPSEKNRPSAQNGPREENASLYWWRSYRDPVLETVVDSALSRNLDLEMAVQRVLEVQQMHAITRAGQYPSLGLTGEGTRQSTPTNSGATGRFSENIPLFPDRFDILTYSASLGLSYELDFWGKARAGARAAFMEYLATSSDYQTVKHGIIAETIGTYFEVRDLSKQIALSRANEELLSERVELTEARYNRGLVSSFELYAVRQSLDDVRSTTPLINSRENDAVGRLAVLLGTVPDEIRLILAGTEATSLSMEPVKAGLPSELLERRPDVRAATARLEAARQRIGVARAERLPSLSLTAAGGTQSSDLSKLVETGQRFGSIAGSLVAPIFRAGALNANVKASWARYRQAEALYDKTVLLAFKDVSSALVESDAEWQRLHAVQRSLESAGSSAETQLLRYRRGIGDYLALLDARINAVRVRLNLAAAEHAAAVSRLGIHRAIGGRWTESSHEPGRSGTD